MSEEFKFYGYLDRIIIDTEGKVYIILNRRSMMNEGLIKTCEYLLKGRDVEVIVRRRVRRVEDFLRRDRHVEE